ncbi:MAG: phosphate ABC transporter permease PstA [Granulosicoccaceae bacterium]
MNNSTDNSASDTVNTAAPRKDSTSIVKRTLAKRYAAEKRFRFYGAAAIGISLLFLAVLIGSIFLKGWPAFIETQVHIDVTYDTQTLGVENGATSQELKTANFYLLIKKTMRDMFPDVTERRERKELYKLISTDAEYQIRQNLIDNPNQLGQSHSFWVLADDELSALYKTGGLKDIANVTHTRLSDQQIAWTHTLEEQGRLRKKFNATFFKNGDSREPEQAGIRAALIGSILTLLITFVLSFPIAVATAIYLEEFAPQNRWTDLIEVNINNLAAVPSIVFGLLGLAVFINFFHLPRSAPVVGGIVLSLMTLPTIIISSRAALKSVPPSIREAGRGLGASRLQVVTHHVLPLAMPGILTGTIIGLAQALGETAPLLMIGMVAFIVDIPSSVTDAATVLPVQVFLWADSPERAFLEKTSAAILVLLVFLIVMNAAAVFLRKRFERKW